MKPDWKDAPDWANYLSQDQDGEWWWHANNPFIDGIEWYSFGLMSAVEGHANNWRDTLEERQ